jgi:hypothetical protein
MQTPFHCFTTILILLLLIPQSTAMSESNISLEGLSLTDEGLTLNLDADPTTIQILDHCLIGRVLTDKQIRLSYFKERMGNVWKPGKKVTILPTDAGRYLFQFNHRLDAAKVLDEGPWLFDNYNIVIERIAPGVVPATFQLNHLDLWVQVHHLPFGFVQLKVGQAVGQFLGELKEYDHRNTIHSSYMRLKVRLNINNPLKQSWKVRANEGNFVQIQFKYEKVGIFCYLCGIIGHTDKNCTKLFEMEQDDGVREWGEHIRPVVNRMGTAATNKYIKDPIPSRSYSAAEVSAGTQAGATGSTPSQPAPSNFDGRITAVQREISAIKSGILCAQKQATAKTGKNLIGASSSQAARELPVTPSLIGCTNSQHRPVVLGLLAEPQLQTQGETLLCLQDAEADEIGKELKKRKRAKAAKDIQSDQQIDSQDVNMQGGLEDNDSLGTSVEHGRNIVMSINDNPLYVDTNVTAGPDVQACREP